MYLYKYNNGGHCPVFMFPCCCWQPCVRTSWWLEPCTVN